MPPGGRGGPNTKMAAANSLQPPLAPLTGMPRPIDRSKPANALVIADETVYFNNTPGVWRRITASCPYSDGLYVTLTNEMTLPPGVLNQVRRQPLKLYQDHYRPTEVSLQFIRWLRSMLLRATCYREAMALLRPLMEKHP